MAPSFTNKPARGRRSARRRKLPLSLWSFAALALVATVLVFKTLSGSQGRIRRDSDADATESASNIGSKLAKSKFSSEIEFKPAGDRGDLYNEGRRKELYAYWKESEDPGRNSNQNKLITALDDEVHNVDLNDEYDDGIDPMDELEENAAHGHDKNGASGQKWEGSNHQGIGDTILQKAGGASRERIGKNYGSSSMDIDGKPLQVTFERIIGVDGAANEEKELKGKKTGGKKKPKRKKWDSSTCEMKFLNSTAQLVEPVRSEKFARFQLKYRKRQVKPVGNEMWEPKFAGHQTLQEREESFYAHDQELNCGFIKGPDGSSTGFDIFEDDLKYMSGCRFVVSSCIFGNSDRLRSPSSKTITNYSRRYFCFVMFLDEETLLTLSSEGQNMDSNGFIGVWKIVVVTNLPYNDMRRVGKIPKFLAHRLFPSSRASIWLDSKLRLQVDPFLILEYFLWRHDYEYAISNHYDRHCVWEEVTQNKKLNKYNHTIIDEQFEFYKKDGLTRFDPTDPNKLLPSYVPEGSFIVREHTPMSNLFSCLWFNEVERFTPRDQLSFAYTYLKLRRTNPSKSFCLNMFKDCERRKIGKLFHHRSEEKHATPEVTM